MCGSGLKQRGEGTNRAATQEPDTRLKPACCSLYYSDA